jgi:pimeloyl-ACP methyl ester carboxylesterase
MRRGIASPWPVVPCLAALCLVALCVGTLGACSGDDESAGTSTTTAAADQPATLERDGSSYVVADPLPAGEPGELIAVGEPTSSTVFPGAQRQELLYHSTDRTGEDVAVSGTLLVPDGDAPEGGWPVISWGHGTTGVADACAPSTTDNLFYNEYAQQVNWFLDAGYAVAATDYVGLGTPGLHSYSVGEDLGNAVADIVPASHELRDDLSPTWYAVGHSEGGQATLFATRSASRHPDYPLAASVAIAPSSHMGLALPFIAAGELPADVVYGLYLLVGLSTVDPSVDPAQLVGPAGASVLDAVTTQDCLLDTLADLHQEDAANIFDLDPDEMARLSDLLAGVGDPDQEPTSGPLLIVQGETDHDIPAAVTAELVQSLRSQGVDVTERVYPGLDHDRVLGPSVCETLAWLAQHGGPAATSCTAAPTDMS